MAEEIHPAVVAEEVPVRAEDVIAREAAAIDPAEGRAATAYVPSAVQRPFMSKVFHAMTCNVPNAEPT